MNPLIMGALLAGFLGVFALSAKRRWDLLTAFRPEPKNRLDHIGERIKGVIDYALLQKKMGYYRAAGLAHKLIFVGFIILLVRTLILWGRGFYAPFNLFILGPEGFFGLPLGHAYEFLKDIVALLVVAGAAVFLYLRIVKQERRMTLSTEGIVILGIIVTMMISDMLYDGAAIALHTRYATLGCPPIEPSPGFGASAKAAFCDGVGTMLNLPTCADGSAFPWMRGDAGGQLCGTASKIVAPLGPLTGEGLFRPYAPMGSLFALAVSGLSEPVLIVLSQIGFWTHSALVLVFLNILPFSKHFHIITSLPNAFTRPLGPKGRLPLSAASTADFEAKLEKYMEEPEKAEPIGITVAQDISWKAILDFYTCTECGRCSDNCPAHRTGKILSPKQLTLDLRDHVYAREDELVAERNAKKKADGANGHAHHAEAHEGEGEGEGAAEEPKARRIDVVPNVIHPDVLWACTTCRACEEQCPVLISYVDKIVEMRRSLVLTKGEFPAQLAEPFGAMETNGNPWNFARVDRAAWSDGLGVPLMADNPNAEVLYWVGCAASYDDRSKKIARATASLLKQAGVDFAILGTEETCTGDPARRAGNEYLFLQLAEKNVETLGKYKDGIRTIVTTCPHCFNTLKNEYPDFGAKFEVVHHTEFLLGLVATKKLVPSKPVKGRVVFHDSCYLGRYNDVYEPPRQILAAIPGVELVEAPTWNRQKGLCCGAGGAQMWMEEQNKDRVNVKRTLQLLEPAPKTIASACPFCMTMLTDGLKNESKEDEVRQLDVVELLAESCVEEGKKAPSKKKAKPAPSDEASA